MHHKRIYVSAIKIITKELSQLNCGIFSPVWQSPEERHQSLIDNGDRSFWTHFLNGFYHTLFMVISTDRTPLPCSKSISFQHIIVFVAFHDSVFCFKNIKDIAHARNNCRKTRNFPHFITTTKHGHFVAKSRSKPCIGTKFEKKIQ